MDHQFAMLAWLIDPLNDDYDPMEHLQQPWQLVTTQPPATHAGHHVTYSFPFHPDHVLSTIWSIPMEAGVAELQCRNPGGDTETANQRG
jgi:hypothetical protein